MRRYAVLLLLLCTAACSKTEEPAPAAKPKPKPRPDPSAGQALREPELARLPAPERLVAIGDLHGDLAVTRSALALAGAIDAEHDWAGGRLVVVQVGDQLDRGDDDRALLDYLQRLQQQARAAGGALVVLNGNHELMNVQGDFRYATAGSFAAFTDARGRKAAFAPGGRYATLLAERPVVAIVGDTVFVHGGLLPEHVRYGIGKLNAEVSGWMKGELAAVPKIALADDAPVWTRAYGGPEPAPADCARLAEVLTGLGVQRMVIGHTIQEQGINPACDGKVWRVDVGLSAHYGFRRPPQVLEISAKGPRVLGADAAARKPRPRAPLPAPAPP